MDNIEHSLLAAFERVKRRELAHQLGITAQAISQWTRVPVERVLDVERITGVPRHELRPDIYPIPTDNSGEVTRHG